MLGNFTFQAPASVQKHLPRDDAWEPPEVKWSSLGPAGGSDGARGSVGGGGVTGHVTHYNLEGVWTPLGGVFSAERTGSHWGAESWGLAAKPAGRGGSRAPAGGRGLGLGSDSRAPAPVLPLEPAAQRSQTAAEHLPLQRP